MTKMTKKDVLTQALKNFDNATEAYREQRSAAIEDLNFVAGDQYSGATPGDDDYKLTVNLLGPFLRQITAEARNANPSIKVVPVSSDEDVDKAEVIGGLIRHIEQKSNSEHVYQNALWYAAAAGEGYFMLDSDYVDSDSFDQELLIKAIDNPAKVFLDPNHNELDGSDSEWGFIIEDIDHGTYRRKFPDSALTERLTNNQWDRLQLPRDWLNDDTVRIAKYWVKDYQLKRRWLVQDPLTLETSVVEEKPGDDVVVLNKRDSYDVTVKAYTLSCYEILEETTWPGKYIPIVKVVGENFWVGGQKAQFGAIRMAKDPQRQYNYAVSKETEMIDMAPKNSFVIADKQLGNHSEKWANANRVNYGALPYVHIDGAPPPNRVAGIDAQSFGTVIQARTQAFEDMKLVFGLGDASLGQPGNEVSGVAIDARVEQSSRSNYQYFDHLLLGMKHLGRMIIDVLPTFYDTERTIRIVKPTNEDQLVIINSMKNKMKYDLTKGEYDIIVTTGPAFSSKRQAAYDALKGIMDAIPNAPIGDLVAGQVDSPIARQASARLKAMLPPEILAATGEDNQNDMAPKELVQKVQSENAQLQIALKKMDAEKAELEAKLHQVMDDSIVQLKKAHMEDEQKKAQLELDAKTAEMEFTLKMMELELTKEKLNLARDEMAIKASVAANDILDSHKEHEDKEVKFTNVSMPDTNIEDDIGGQVDH